MTEPLTAPQTHSPDVLYVSTPSLAILQRVREATLALMRAEHG